MKFNTLHDSLVELDKHTELMLETFYDIEIQDLLEEGRLNNVLKKIVRSADIKSLGKFGIALALLAVINAKGDAVRVPAPAPDGKGQEPDAGTEPEPPLRAGASRYRVYRSSDSQFSNATVESDSSALSFPVAVTFHEGYKFQIDGVL